MQALQTMGTKYLAAPAPLPAATLASFTHADQQAHCVALLQSGMMVHIMYVYGLQPNHNPLQCLARCPVRVAHIQ